MRLVRLPERNLLQLSLSYGHRLRAAGAGEVSRISLSAVGLLSPLQMGVPADHVPLRVPRARDHDDRDRHRLRVHEEAPPHRQGDEERRADEDLVRRKDVSSDTRNKRNCTKKSRSRTEIMGLHARD